MAETSRTSERALSEHSKPKRSSRPQRPLTDSEAAEFVAQKFHERYEELAPEHGYKTREASAKPWAEVPLQNRMLMIDVVSHLLGGGIIECNCTTEDDDE